MLSVRFMGICNLRETERFQSPVIITPPATLSVWPHTLLQCQPLVFGHMRLYFCGLFFFAGFWGSPGADLQIQIHRSLIDCCFAELRLKLLIYPS